MDLFKYIAVDELNEAKHLLVLNAEMPIPKEHEILIKVHAAGINRPDLMQRQGKYPPPANASPHLGLEVAGIVVGGDLSSGRFTLGDEVCALVNGGGYAEFVVAPIGQCLPIPVGLNMIEAASLPETFFTVWSNVWMHAQLQEHDSLLVHGGASGIGVTAIQLAKAFGHQVFVTAGSDVKCDRCEALGAKKAINYRTQDFVQVLHKLTFERGVDVILDMVAGEYTARNLTVLADGGRLVNIALQGGRYSTIDMARILMRRLTITGSTLRGRTNAFKAAIAQALLENVWPLFEQQKIRPVIDRVFGFDEANLAHEYMAQNKHVGKIVLRVI